MGFGSGEGSSPSDPPFAQLGGEGTSGGWKDKLGQIGAGLANSGDDDFKKGLAGAGDMKAFQKRRDMNKRIQERTPDQQRRQGVRDLAEQTMNSFSGGME